jgi:hypothetical protein
MDEYPITTETAKRLAEIRVEASRIMKGLPPKSGDESIKSVPTVYSIDGECLGGIDGFEDAPDGASIVVR